MKLLRSSLLLTLALPLFGAAADEPAPAFTINDCAWIAGSWSAENNGRTIEEHWMAPAGGTMSGMARMVAGPRTAFHEYLRIITANDGGIDYMAQPIGRCPAVAFRLTKLSATEATFENPQHDNPKLISYSLEDNGATLVTVTQGEVNGEPVSHKTRMQRASLVPGK